MRVTSQVSALQLITSFGFCILVSLCGVLKADWAYAYSDDFAANKAIEDSYRHSMFWSKGAVSPSEPYVYYTEINRNRELVFMDYKGQLAELGYRFPLASEQASRAVKGVLAVDVSFPSTAEISQQVPGRLEYRVAPDGTQWSSAQSLAAGRREILLTAGSSGACYVLFSGTRAAIDDLVVSLGSSAPLTIQVPRDFPTIQAAINAAADGDVIEVAPGAYSTDGFRDVHFRGKAITVRSAAGPENTIIDCGGAHRGFCFYEGEGADSVLSGFTIVSGRAPNSLVPSDPLRWTGDPICGVGGAIYCAFTSPTIDNCIFDDCGAQAGGAIGGVGASPTIVDCVIEQCFAGQSSQPDSRGGAIALLGALNAYTPATISKCIIRGNTGSDTYTSFGAGLYFQQSVAIVAECTISDNTAPGALQGGGACCIGSGAGVEVTFRNCIFSGNMADMGAGLYVDWPRGRVSVINCTLAYNRLRATASSMSAAGIQSGGADLLVTSSILWGNAGKALVMSGGTISSVSYSDIEGGYPGNLNADPLFADAGSEDYHLRSTTGRYNSVYGRWLADTVQSPCIDAGDPEASFDDEPLPNGNRINMGAYGGTKEASMTAPIRYVDCNNNHPGAYTTIQEAIDAASDGDTVLVYPGRYNEKLNFEGKAITVQSAEDAAVLTSPDYAVSFLNWEGPNSVLKNFVIIGCPYPAILCQGASPTLKNLTIVNNAFGISALDGADPKITNCIIWHNGEKNVGNLSGCRAYYSDVEGGATDPAAQNIQREPLFGDPATDDYHLLSAGGRWVPAKRAWVKDIRSSPCIDAGDPGDDPGDEPAPNGNRINMGAHGGTRYASKSP
jgi:hypothetical protein